MTIKEAIFSPIATIVTPVFLALTLAGCGQQDYRRVCVRGGNVAKIHEATTRQSVIELQDGTIMSYGWTVKVGDYVCLEEKREPITATK